MAEEMKIFMVVYDKVPNTNNGTMGYVVMAVGSSYPIAGKGILELRSISEGIGRNNKPVVTLVFEKGVVIEVPDYNVEKYRTYEQTGEKTTDKTRKS